MPILEPMQLYCPYCGEPIDIWIDLSGGSQSYIEDCQVCCRPIQLVISVDSDGAVEIQALSGDE